MAILLKSTDHYASNGVKVCVYGQAGAGKTRLIATLPNVVILNVEGGLLSIKDYQLPYKDVTSIALMDEMLDWLERSPDAGQFESVAIDSLSQLGEVILTEQKKMVKDPRQAYGAMQDLLSSYISRLHNLPGRNVYFTSKLDKATDELGSINYAPCVPGNKFSMSLPHMFDELFALRTIKDSDGNVGNWLQTSTDGIWSAKDRSGKLAAWEPPHLGNIIQKIKGA